jgi:hypothetical protein
MDYKLVIRGRGARIRLKAASKALFNFWADREEEELVEYLQAGQEGFDAFPVPKAAQVSFMGDNLRDVDMFIFDEGEASKRLKSSLPAFPMEVPESNWIESVELWKMGAKDKLVSSADSIQLVQLKLGDVPADIGVRTPEYTLVCVEWVESEWIYVWHGLSKPPKISDFRYLPINLDGSRCDLTDCLGEVDLIGMIVLPDGAAGQVDVNPIDVADTNATILKGEE